MIEYKDFYINFYKTDYTCPYYEKLNKNNDDKYFNRIKKNKT